MSAATPAPIWWCEEHGDAAPNPDEKACYRGIRFGGPCDLVPRLLVDPSALVVERDATALHDLIADAIWESTTGDTLEGPCEVADAVLFALGVTEKGCGPNGHVTPFPHPGALFAAIDAARREAST